ncbi:MAG TPA: type II secretion system F family protein [Fimbriimonadaceae bacterium]|nr:type II secretion system F family protein [Fimbriimonadaceae bacterium]
MDEATRGLALQGFVVTGIRDPRVAQTSVPPVASHRPTESPAPVRPVQLNPTAPRSLGEPVKTRFSKDSDIYFIFSQLASYFRSGLSASQAFRDIGQQQQRDDLRDALLRVSARVEEGSGIADVLALYPYLFAPHVVGTVRAAETGGYLPDALDSIADQADSSRKMRRLMVWLGWFAIGIPPTIPFGIALFNAVLKSWDVQEATGGTAPVATTVGRGFMQELLGPLGIYSFVVGAIFLFIAFYWQSLKMRPTRHRLALLVPTVGKRARAESFAAFTWNLSNLSRAAVPPRRAFTLALATVPNEAIRHELEVQANRMTDQTKLSEALGATKMLPFELGAMVQTGEVTGDVSGQLLNGAASQMEAFVHEDRSLKSRVYTWMAILFFFVAPLVLLWMYSGFLIGLIQKLTGG